jgi:serine/threonine protein kinase
MSPSRRRSAALDQSMEADLLSRLDHEHIIKLYGVTCSRDCHSPACANSTTYCEKHHNTTTSHEDEEDAAEYHPNHDPLLECLGHCLVLELLQETLQDRLVAWRRRSCSVMMLHPRFRMGLFSPSALRHRLETVVMGIVKGMVYLHSHSVLVRDLKPANIGFDCNGTVKLFDFGLARELHECTGNGEEEDAAGSLRYLAPERLLLPVDSNTNQTPISLSSDVYSLGLLIWEIFTLQKPYNDYRTVSAFKEHVVQRQERPCLQRMFPSQLLPDLIAHCWDPCPTNRPSLVQVQAVLETKLAPRPKAYASRLDLRIDTLSSSTSACTRTRTSKKKKNKLVAAAVEKKLDDTDTDDSRPRHLPAQRKPKARHLGGLVLLNRSSGWQKQSSSRSSLTSCMESVTYHSSRDSLTQNSRCSMMSRGWDSFPIQAATSATTPSKGAGEEDLCANLALDAWISENEASLDSSI